MDLELSVDLDVQVDKARYVEVENKMMNNLHLHQPTFPLFYASLENLVSITVLFLSAPIKI